MAVIARNKAGLRVVAGEVESSGRAIVLAADVTDAEAFQAARGVGRIGEHIDILVNNAGGNSFSMPLVATRFSGWEKTMRLNVDSIVHACSWSCQGLLESGFREHHQHVQSWWRCAAAR